MNLKFFLKSLSLLFLAILFSSCSSSKISKNQKQCQRYSRVIINDFQDKINKSQRDPYIISEGKRFADLIGSRIISKGLFSIVERNIDSFEEGLLIDGDITKYAAGNAIARSVIGFGVGSARLNAKIYLRDNKTKKIIDCININKTSWLPGGLIASMQDIEFHMKYASNFIANTCSKFRDIKK